MMFINRRVFVSLCIFLLGYYNETFAQSRYIDRSGRASFFSEAPLEDIEAHTAEAMSLLDIQTGEIVASIAMRSFEFDKSLMQEHFNENYVESHKYPKAIFKGKIENMDKKDLSKEGVYPVVVSGEMTIHGVTKPIRIKGELKKEGNQLTAHAKFPLKVADFDIKIPSIVMFNIAEEVEVTVSFSYEPLNP